MLEQLERTFGTQVSFEGGKSIVDFTIDNQGFLAKTVDIKSRDIPKSWITSKGLLREAKIEAFELTNLGETLKHIGSTKRPETMLYVLKGATPAQAEEYAEIVRRTHANFLKLNPGIKPPGLGVTTFGKLERVADKFWKGVTLRRGGKAMKLPKVAAAEVVPSPSKVTSVEQETKASAPSNLAMAEKEILEEQPAQTAKSVGAFTKFLIWIGYGGAIDATAGETGTSQPQEQKVQPRVGDPIQQKPSEKLTEEQIKAKAASSY